MAAQQFEFEPAEMSGKKIAVQITYKYRFKLTQQAPAPVVPPPEAATAPQAPPATPSRPHAGARPRSRTSWASCANAARACRSPGVLVTVFRDDGQKALGFEATSDASGAFQFFDLNPGDWKILIEPPGFYPYRTTETVKPGERIDAVYYVERGSYNPYDVTVTATRPRKEVSRTVISAQELDKIPGTFGDPLAVIQNFAGVARPPPFLGLLIIRGSAPQDSRVFADGADIPLIYHFGALRTVLPVGIIDSIQFYPGNFSPMYGRAIGGVIDVQIKKLQPKKVGGYADVNLFDSGVYLEAPLGDKGGIAVAGRRSYIDYLINAAVPANAPVNVITAPRYYDYQLLANYRPSPAHDLRLFVFGSDDRLELLFRNPGALTAQITNNTVSFSTTFYRALATYNYVPGDGFDNSLRLSLGPNVTHFNFGQFVLDLEHHARPAPRQRPIQIQRTLHAGRGRGHRLLEHRRVRAGASAPDGGHASRATRFFARIMTTDRKGVGRLVTRRLRRGRAEAGAEPPAPARAARRLFRQRPPNRRAASRDRAVVGDRAPDPEGRRGNLRAGAHARPDRPELRKPGPEDRTRHSLFSGRRIQAPALDHPGRDRRSTRISRIWSAGPTRWAPTPREHDAAALRQQWPGTRLWFGAGRTA